jgi:anti-anti-sigma factor
MEIKVQKLSGEVVILLNGTLNGSTACEIEHAIQPLLESGGTRLVFDFSGVRNVERFGLIIFANVLRSQQNQFSEVTVAGLQPAVQKLFRRYGLPGSQLRPGGSSGEETKSEFPSWQTS